MKAPAFLYHRPASRDEALALLASLPDARLLAGGQSLMAMLNLRLVAPASLIDLNRVAGLDVIEDAGTEIGIGAMVRQLTLERSALVRARLPLLAEAASQIGHLATRGRGTIGGSLCHLDPAAELPVAALAHDARVRVASARGMREIAMADFAASLMTTTVADDEMVTEIVFPVWRPGHGAAFVEFARRHGDFAVVAVAVLVDRAPDGTIARVAIAIGGLAPVPFRLGGAEKILRGGLPSADLIAAASHATDAIDALDDPHAPASYRRQIAPAIVRRALEAALSRGERAAA